MNMRTLLIVLMSEYGDTFLLSFYVELKSTSRQISLQQETSTMLGRTKNNCKRCPVEQTSSTNSIGLTSVWGIPSNHLVA